MALRNSPRLVGVVLLNAVGIDTGSADRTIVDPMAVPPTERAALAFYNPTRFAIAPSTPEAQAIMANNQQTLRVYAGEPFMHDPTLRGRLAQMRVPTLVICGASDRIVDAEYGRLYANSIPDACFELVSEAAHFPQIEQLDAVTRLIEGFSSGAAPG